ncbi:MAG TPA: hypothetical protein VHU82_14285 [Vicinamibacterales bacterium]|jgi:hypothetical protein|nr:hypothetical protein [Vicinamibacterales bacterium]
MVLAAALIVAAAIVWSAQTLVRVLGAARADTERARQTELLRLFAAGVASARTDPSSLLAWQPLARIARRLFPDDFAAFDRAAGGAFPFTKEQIEAAHARWTAQWLAWESNHDAEFKLKASVAEHELTASGGSPVMRARLDAVEREKLERYQRRYEEYIRTAKALQALTADS